MKILVINAGSSSLKYQLFDMDTGEVIAKGLCEKIGIGGIVTHKRPGKETYKKEVDLPDHDAAIALVLSLLTDKEVGVISDVSEIGAVGHRVVHGGEKLKNCIIGPKELDYLRDTIPLNPLHAPPAIKGIEACQKLMPDIPHVGVFDTAFYADMPAESYIYPIPYEYYEKYRIRRYGFHGTSHRYVSGAAAEFLGRDIKTLKMITCHLGNGSSISAIKNGVCVDTSMGFTPQEGLPMGTRSGSLDPTAITYLAKQLKVTPEEMDDILNRHSGLLGMSGVSSDCREVMQADDAGNPRAHLAMQVFYHYVKKLIGAYTAEMNGLDVLVFTAGIGENDSVVRSRICADLDYLGIRIDNAVNASLPRGTAGDITAKGGSVRVLVIPTNEEYMIAKDTLALVQANS